MKTFVHIPSGALFLAALAIASAPLLASHGNTYAVDHACIIKQDVAGFAATVVETLDTEEAEEENSTFGSHNHPAVSVSTNISASDYLVRVNRLIEEGRPHDAVELLHEQLEYAQEGLIDASSGTYQTLGVRAAHMMHAHPSLADAWRSRYGIIAQQQLEQAVLDFDFVAIRSIALRHAATEAGLQAYVYLAAYEIESAQPTRALGWLNQVGMHPDVEAYLPQVNVLRSYAYALLRREKDWQDVRALADDSHGAAMDAFRLALHADLSTLRTADMNMPVASQLGSDVLATSMPLWTQVTPLRPAFAKRAYHYFNAEQHAFAHAAAETGPHCTYATALRESQLMVHLGTSLVAIDAWSGDTLWRYDKETLYDYYQPQPFRSIQPIFYGHKIFAVMQSMNENSADASNRVVYGGGGSSNNQVVMFNAADGDIVWQKDAVSCLRQQEAVDTNMRWGATLHQIVGQPIISQAHVYVTLEEIKSDYETMTRTTYLVCMNAETGEHIWQSQASMMRQASRGWNMELASVALSGDPVVKIFDNDIYYYDGYCTLMAIDHLTGELKWQGVYQEHIDAIANESQMHQSQHIFSTHGIHVRDNVVCLAAGSVQAKSLLWIDALSGKVVAPPYQDLHELCNSLDNVWHSMIALDEGALLVGDSHVVRFDNTWQPVWQTPYEGTLLSVPVILSDSCVCHTANGLTVINLETGVQQSAISAYGTPVVYGDLAFMLQFTQHDMLLRQAMPWQAMKQRLKDHYAATGSMAGAQRIIQLALGNTDYALAFDTLAQMASSLDVATINQAFVWIQKNMSELALAPSTEQYAFIQQLQLLAQTPGQLGVCYLLEADYYDKRGDADKANHCLQLILADQDMFEGVDPQHALYGITAHRQVRLQYENPLLLQAESAANFALANIQDRQLGTVLQVAQRFPLTQASLDAVMVAAATCDWQKIGEAQKQQVISFLKHHLQVQHWQAASVLLHIYNETNEIHTGLLFLEQLDIAYPDIELTYLSQQLTPAACLALWQQQGLHGLTQFSELHQAYRVDGVAIPQHQSIYSKAGFDNRVVLTVDLDEKQLMCWDVSGKLLWRHDCPAASEEEAMSSTAYILGQWNDVLVLRDGSHLYGFSIAEGRLAFTYALKPSVVQSIIEINSAGIFYAYKDENNQATLQLIAPETLETIWQRTFDHGYEKIMVDMEGTIWVLSNPEYSNGMYGTLSQYALRNGAFVQSHVITDQENFYALKLSGLGNMVVISEEGAQYANTWNGFQKLDSPLDMPLHAHTEGHVLKLDYGYYLQWLIRDETPSARLPVLPDGVIKSYPGLKLQVLGDEIVCISHLTQVEWRVPVATGYTGVQVAAVSAGVIVVAVAENEVCICLHDHLTGQLLSQMVIEAPCDGVPHVSVIQNFNHAFCMVINGYTVIVSDQITTPVESL